MIIYSWVSASAHVMPLPFFAGPSPSPCSAGSGTSADSASAGSGSSALASPPSGGTGCFRVWNPFFWLVGLVCQVGVSYQSAFAPSYLFQPWQPKPLQNQSSEISSPSGVWNYNYMSKFRKNTHTSIRKFTVLSDFRFFSILSLEELSVLIFFYM